MTHVDVGAIKARHDLSSVVARDVRLRRSGHELVGLCPFHEEKTPSFRVNDDKGLFHCFGCGAGGDIIDYVRWRHGLEFAQALQWLEGERPSIIDAPERERRQRATESERGQAVETAQAQWRSALPIAGTPAERYLRSRGIIQPAPPTIRFAWLSLWHTPTGKPGPRLPALIAACEDVAGAVVGVQRIFLTNHGQKAAIKNPKLSLGQVRGCALRLGPVAAEIMLCEGPEDGLTLRQRFPGASVWVSLGTGNLPFVELPDMVESVVIAGDNNAAGVAAAEAAAMAFAEQGKGVAVVFPDPAYSDWNDELMEHPTPRSEARADIAHRE